MPRTERPTEDALAERSSRSPVSVAILAALAFVPVVVAAGFLTDTAAFRSAAVPGDISVLALRGVFDGGPGERPPAPARAGF
ncbi:hypothetical protein [Lichenibacterium ramalinae]|uniref:Uncharacterized protein n=1 Tax=Lichenibacterium ramalinae TaxID=2316527 RepID=A0A4Q2RAD9_9HYPH|nr:hypothetical protein [Lichenibacterium ramalinae]RYB03711.1 hypothetical protein D3272_16345 [Lichenibacterium ramalinae]